MRDIRCVLSFQARTITVTLLVSNFVLMQRDILIDFFAVFSFLLLVDNENIGYLLLDDFEKTEDYASYVREYIRNGMRVRCCQNVDGLGFRSLARRAL